MTESEIFSLVGVVVSVAFACCLVASLIVRDRKVDEEKAQVALLSEYMGGMFDGLIRYSAPLIRVTAYRHFVVFRALGKRVVLHRGQVKEITDTPSRWARRVVIRPSSWRHTEVMLLPSSHSRIVEALRASLLDDVAE